LHLWDLREASDIHKDADAVDLKISCGIRKPSFSSTTELGGELSSLGGKDEAGLSSSQHAGAITALFSLSSASGSQSTSQWGSLDCECFKLYKKSLGG
jgi:hypothetical protein